MVIYGGWCANRWWQAHLKVVALQTQAVGVGPPQVRIAGPLSTGVFHRGQPLNTAPWAGGSPPTAGSRWSICLSIK